jgi:ABC-type transporter Mla subunit MlaD
MQYTDWLKKFAAGLFLVLCFILIVGSVFVIGFEKGFMEPKVQMTVLFRRVGGLMTGSPVRLSGVTVGTVESIDFLDQEVNGRGVRVGLSLYRKYENQLSKSSQIAVVTEGVLGEKMIEITADPGLHRQDLSLPIIGDEPLEVRDIAETFDSTANALFKTSQQIDIMMEELVDLAGATRRLLNRIEQRVIDGNLFKMF